MQIRLTSKSNVCDLEKEEREEGDEEKKARWRVEEALRAAWLDIAAQML